MSNVTLKLDGLKKAYNHGKPNEVQVLHGVSLQVAKGEVVAERSEGLADFLGVVGSVTDVDHQAIAKVGSSSISKVIV